MHTILSSIALKQQIKTFDRQGDIENTVRYFFLCALNPVVLCQVIAWRMLPIGHPATT